MHSLDLINYSYVGTDDIGTALIFTYRSPYFTNPYTNNKYYIENKITCYDSGILYSGLHICLEDGKFCYGHWEQYVPYIEEVLEKLLCSP